MNKVGIFLKSGFANLGFGTGAIPPLIQCLEKNGILVSKIIGCSAGSFITPMLAARQYGDVFNSWFGLTPNKISKIHKWQTIRHPFARTSLLDNSPLRDYASSFLIPNLELFFHPNCIPFEIITTDIESGEGVYFGNTEENRCRLMDICMASSAIVPFFPPQKIGDKMFIDGAFSDDMPIKRFVESGCDTIIIVDMYNGMPTHDHRDRNLIHWPASLPRGMQISIQQHSRLRLDLGEMINKTLDVLEKSKVNGHVEQELKMDGFFKCRFVFVTAEIPILHVDFRRFDDEVRKKLPEIGYWAAKTSLVKLGLNQTDI